MKAKRVYFLRPVGMKGPIKIGCSCEPEKRLRSVEIWSPQLLEIIATAPGDHDHENVLHQMFGDDRLHGEWFHPSERLTSVIDHALSTGHLPPLDMSLSLYARRRTDPKARSSMTRRTPPRAYAFKSRLTKMVQDAEKHAYGFSWMHCLRPEVITRIIDSYQGFSAPLPGPRKIAALEKYAADLRSLPAADNSAKAWRAWVRSIAA